MSDVSLLQNALDVQRKRVDIISGNLARLDVEGAHREDGIASAQRDSRGNVIGVKLNALRNADPYAQQSVRMMGGKASCNEVIRDGIAHLENILSDPADNSASVLVSGLSNFLTQATAASSNTDIGVRQSLVDEAKRLCDTISTVSQEILNLRMQADIDIKTNLISMNSVIDGLHNFNKLASSAGIGGTPSLDERDNLLRDLARYCEINVNYGPNGEAFVSDRTGNIQFVGRSGVYTHMSYTGVVSSEDLLTGTTVPPIKATLYTDKGGVISVFDDATPKLNGGKIAGYMSLRDTMLPNSQSAITSLVSLVADKVNSLHNQHSTFPPKISLTSSKQMALSDAVNWQGNIVINPVYKDSGMPVATNVSSGQGNFVRPVTIDLGNLPGTGIGGQVTMQDIITEINATMASGMANRVGIGAVRGADGNIIGAEYDLTHNLINGEHLVNNITLVGRSNINTQSGGLSFDLELDGSNYFGSDIEILAVNVYDATSTNLQYSVPTNQLPSSFRLDKGLHLRTNKTINIDNLDISNPNQIAISVRVKGDNGVVEEGVVQFAVNPATTTNMVNSRISGSVAPFTNSMPTSGAAAGLANSAHGLRGTNNILGSAKLINQYDNSVNSIFESGKLVLEGSSGVALILDRSTSMNLDTGNDFNTEMAFSNFFVKDTLHGTLSVDPSIAGNVQNMALGRLAPVYKEEIVSKGTQNANLNFAFADNNLNALTITVNGWDFTFGNAVGEVSVGVDEAASAQNLTAAINSHPLLSAEVRASVQTTLGLPMITLQAVQAGVSGNAFNVSTSAGFNISLYDTQACMFAGAAQATGRCFSGGADATETIQVRELNIGEGSFEFSLGLAKLLRDGRFDIASDGKLVPQYSGTLSMHATLVTGLLMGQVIDAQRNQESTEKALVQLYKGYLEQYGIVDTDEMQKLQQLAKSQVAIMKALKIVQDTDKTIVDIL